jgi:hypothetical protein
MGKAIVGLIAAITAAPALGCIPPPPIARLPGESQQAYQDRQNAAFAAEEFENRRLAQTAMLDEANAVFVGVVSASHEIDVGSVKGHEISVEPVQSIKGDLPKQPVTVSDTVFTDCGISGGGSATSAKPADYVIVFAGLPTNALQGPNVGILAKEAQLPELIGALSHYALTKRK